MKNKLMALSSIIILTACNPAPNMALTNQAYGTDSGDRFTVSRVGVFEDEIAYDNIRGIYIIVDTKTGKEFVGVSGIGISEVGSHHSGKTTVSDER